MLPAMSVARGVGVSIVLLVALGGLAWLFFTSEPVAPDPAARGPAAPTEPAQGLPGREDPLTRRLGAGSVRGRVLSADDAPIAGATVCALATSELADDLRRFPTCTSSADDGSYQLAGLLAVPQRIVASAANFLPATWSVGEGPARTDLLALAAGQERRDIDLTLRPAAPRCAAASASSAAASLKAPTSAAAPPTPAATPTAASSSGSHRAPRPPYERAPTATPTAKRSASPLAAPLSSCSSPRPSSAAAPSTRRAAPRSPTPASSSPPPTVFL
jgi:hypothetical protein